MAALALPTTLFARWLRPQFRTLGTDEIRAIVTGDTERLGVTLASEAFADAAADAANIRASNGSFRLLQRLLQLIERVLELNELVVITPEVVAVHAGLAPLSPQDLRRAAIHDLIESGVSLPDVHRRFGFVSHLTLATRYDHRDFTDERLRAWLNVELPDLTVARWSPSVTSGADA